MIEINHLDLNITEHCTHRCVSCSHASPILPPWSMPLEMIERDLDALKPILRCRNIQLVGGEPTLHKQIVDVMRLVKAINIGNLSVITNGSLLHRMPEEFWSELEYLQISIYPGKDAHVDLAREKAAFFGFGLGETNFTEFHRQFKTIPDDGAKSFENCHWKSDCYTVHRGHFHLCPQSTFFPKAVMGLPDSIDGLPLEGITEEALRARFVAPTKCSPLRGKNLPGSNGNRSQPTYEKTVH
jgi:hypothetical protein